MSQALTSRITQTWDLVVGVRTDEIGEAGGRHRGYRVRQGKSSCASGVESKRRHRHRVEHKCPAELDSNEASGSPRALHALVDLNSS